MKIFSTVKNRSRNIKSIILGIASILSLLVTDAHAQCNVFNNADGANPILSALPAGTVLTSLDFVDIDGDGDADCFVIPANGAPQLYKNLGTKSAPRFEKQSDSGFENTSTPLGSPVIQFVDIDGDDDFDCFITEVNYGFRPVTAVRFYRNDGTRTQPMFVGDEENNPVNFASSTNNFVQFTFVDIDKDGDMDFYYTGFYNSVLNDYDQQTYLNTGSKTNPYFELYTNEHPHDFERQRTYFDWNKDGLPDYVKYNDILNVYTYQQNMGPLLHPSFSGNNEIAPVFNNGMPFRIVDLNNDGSKEAFTASGHYATLAPVAIIKKEEKRIGNRSMIRLGSVNQSSTYSYQWEYNGRIIPFYSKPFIYAIKKGTYVLYVKDDCGTGVSIPFAIKNNNLAGGSTFMDDLSNTFNSSLAIADEIKMAVYPNPFVSELSLSIPASLHNTISQVKVLDFGGRQVASFTTQGGILKIGKNLSKGSYLIQIWQQNELVYHTTVVKQ